MQMMLNLRVHILEVHPSLGITRSHPIPSHHLHGRRSTHGDRKEFNLVFQL